MMSKRIIGALTLAMMTQLTSAQEVIQVLVGRQRTLPMPYATKFYIGDPSVATARDLPDQRQIIVTGIKTGTTSLTIYYPNGSVSEKMIRVFQHDPQTVIGGIREIYGEIEGVEFNIKAGEVVAAGAIYTQADLETFEAIKKRYPQIIDRVIDKSEKLMISVTVEVMEIDRSKGTDLGNGMLPPTMLNFQSETGLTPFWSFGVTDDILNRLAWWKSSGLGKVIAHPTLSVTDGDTATFLAGGEVPIAINTGLGAVALEYKKYGVILEVVPKITGSGKIMLDMTAEVSNIDFSVQDRQTGAPGLLKRQVDSKGLVEEGGVVLLAGIYQKMISKNRKRVPILGHLLPFIFSSVKNTEVVKELVILVTPQTPVVFDLKDYPMIEKERKSAKKGK